MLYAGGWKGPGEIAFSCEQIPVEAERDEAMKRIRGAEVTRFKGLGEISPKEFRRFISEDIKLLPVTITSIKDIRDKMEFYMGDNTPQRREFIMENLLNVSG